MRLTLRTALTAAALAALITAGCGSTPEPARPAPGKPPEPSAGGQPPKPDSEASNGLEISLSVSPAEWKLPEDPQKLPVCRFVLTLEAKNGGNQDLRLASFNPMFLEVADERGQPVAIRNLDLADAELVARYAAGGAEGESACASDSASAGQSRRSRH